MLPPFFASNTEYVTLESTSANPHTVTGPPRETPATMAFPMRHLDSSTCLLILAKEPRQSDPSQVRMGEKKELENR
jgi:hypothetical protein